MKIYGLVMVCSIVLLSCNSNSSQSGNNRANAADSLLNKPTVDSAALNLQVNKPEDRKLILLKLTDTILELLAQKNYQKFADYFHSEGVRFSPYSYINTNTDRVFNKMNFLKLANGNNSTIWGSFDGSGENIEQNVATYFKNFVFDANYNLLNTKKVNTPIQQTADNQNINEIYKGLDFVNCHNPPSPKLEFDYSNLILVFKDDNLIIKLFAVVHNQHTL